MQKEREVLAVSTFLLQDIRDVFVSISRVDDQGDLGQTGGPDVRAEHRLLYIPRRAIIKVIEARLADPDHLWVVRQFRDPHGVGNRFLRCVVRMDADRAPEVRLHGGDCRS